MQLQTGRDVPTAHNRVKVLELYMFDHNCAQVESNRHRDSPLEDWPEQGLCNQQECVDDPVHKPLQQAVTMSDNDAMTFPKTVFGSICIRITCASS